VELVEELQAEVVALLQVQLEGDLVEQLGAEGLALRDESFGLTKSHMSEPAHGQAEAQVGAVQQHDAAVERVARPRRLGAAAATHAQQAPQHGARQPTHLLALGTMSQSNLIST